MKARKILAVVLALVLSIACLAGCQRQAGDNADKTPGAADTNNASNNGGNSGQQAVAYPTGTVTINCAFGAGGDTDTVARITAEYLTKYFGETFVVVNVTGAGGNTCAIEVMGKEPDGYNLMFTGDTAFATAVGAIDYAYKDAFQYIGTVGKAVPNVLCCLKDNKYGWTSMEDVLAYIEEHPDEITISDVAGTTTSMLPVVMNLNGYHVRRLDVGSGGADRWAAMLGGQVDLTAISYMSAAEYIKSGDVIALCNQDPGDGMAAFDDSIPNVNAFGLDNGYQVKYYSMFAPADTPQEIVDILDGALAEMTQDPAFLDALLNAYCTGEHLSPAEAIEYDSAQIERYAEFAEYLFS